MLKWFRRPLTPPPPPPGPPPDERARELAALRAEVEADARRLRLLQRQIQVLRLEHHPKGSRRHE